jgi:hypothetical protein
MYIIVYKYITYDIRCSASMSKLEPRMDSHNAKWKILIGDLTKPCILNHTFEVYLEK